MGTLLAVVGAFGLSIAHGQVEQVRPIQWSKFKSGPSVLPGDDFGEKLVDLLQRHSRYVLRQIDHDYSIADDLPTFTGVKCYYPFAHHDSTEYSIRPLGDLALGIAVMLKTGIYSTKEAALDEKDALHRAELAIRGIALTHRANRMTGRNWGGRCSNSTCWQAAYWASLAAQASWMLWDDLHDDTRLAVARMVEYEADSFRKYRVPYWKNADGVEIHPGDTKSEENAWNARLLAVAQAMMPNHADIAHWREKASELQVSAYCRPSDLTNGTAVDGKPVREWINGSNMTEDGVLVNHGMIQPDYIACDAELRGNTAIVTALARQQTPASTLFNASVVYCALTELGFKPGKSSYSTGEIKSPGGPIYIRTGSGKNTAYSPRVFYPQGGDWVRDDIPIIMGAHLNEDVFADVFELDKGKSFNALGWARVRVDRMLEMQRRSDGAGNVYQLGDWLADYYSTEQVLFETNASTWLMWWLFQHGKISPIGPGWAPLPQSQTSHNQQ
jgi:hypothetical protein